jgi:hypothetical protein
MRNLQITHGQFKAADEPEWIYVRGGPRGRPVTHKFPFRLPDEVDPWAFVMHHAFLGWRAIRHSGDLLLLPDEDNWGMA